MVFPFSCFLNTNTKIKLYDMKVPTLTEYYWPTTNMTQLNIKFDSFFLIRCCFVIDFWATKQDIIKGIAEDDLALIFRKRSNKMRLWHKIKNYLMVLILFDKILTANQELSEILNGWAISLLHHLGSGGKWMLLGGLKLLGI